MPAFITQFLDQHPNVRTALAALVVALIGAVSDHLLDIIGTAGDVAGSATGL